MHVGALESYETKEIKGQTSLTWADVYTVRALIFEDDNLISTGDSTVRIVNNSSRTPIQDGGGTKTGSALRESAPGFTGVAAITTIMALAALARVVKRRT